MSRPDSAESYNDLKCLNENIEYYRNTGGQYDTFKPEKLVVSLVKIAEEAIQKACRKLPKPGNLNGVSTFGATADIPSPVLPADYDRGLTNIAYSQSSPFPAAPHVNTMDDTEQTDMSFLQYPNWLEHSSFDHEDLSVSPQGMEGWASPVCSGLT